jgi:hypothetical protein
LMSFSSVEPFSKVIFLVAIYSLLVISYDWRCAIWHWLL